MTARRSRRSGPCATRRELLKTAAAGTVVLALGALRPGEAGAEASLCFERALELDPRCPAAHRGLQDRATLAGDRAALQHAYASRHRPPPTGQQPPAAR